MGLSLQAISFTKIFAASLLILLLILGGVYLFSTLKSGQSIVPPKELPYYDIYITQVACVNASSIDIIAHNPNDIDLINVNFSFEDDLGFISVSGVAIQRQAEVQVSFKPADRNTLVTKNKTYTVRSIGIIKGEGFARSRTDFIC
jgi:hypothetical protein